MNARPLLTFPLTPFAAIGIAAWVIATGAQAHGDEHAAPRVYDAKQVEPTEFGQEGNPAKVTRTIPVDMTDTMRFTPGDLQIKRGETIRFVVRNSGQVLHEMVLGTHQALKQHAALMQRFPGMEHADANMAHVKPGQTGDIVWQFTQAGEFQFACLQPGHFEAGMVGKLVVR
ncbi:cupredoxin domain-containing protein [Roseateles chitosanitabidus]|uniref:cupredoxin domain-containing protein n=1 Tax=Roseateles chitosanitabidus TaxID=65048 RepID=UPI000830DE27|nr:cupredoxin family protein [Roseateles chitosanitabidus]